MPSHVSQLVTLLAFTAHAVLGCCGHHAHANHAGSCGSPAAVAVGDECPSHCHHVAGHCDHVAGHCDHVAGHCDHVAGHCDHEAAQAHQGQQTCCTHSEHRAASDSLVTPPVDAAWCVPGPIPCKDAHECGGVRCAYVSTTSQEINSRSVAEPLVLPLLVERGASPLDWATSVPAPGHRQCTPPLSGAACCALLQSWQI